MGRRFCVVETLRFLLTCYESSSFINTDSSTYLNCLEEIHSLPRVCRVVNVLYVEAV